MNYKSILVGILLSVFTPFTYAYPNIKDLSTDQATSNYAKTKYPMVFAHGLFGFGSINFGISNTDYFYKILPDLNRNGGEVYMTSVSPMHASETRGEQMLRQVERIIAITGHEKVNLIGHSHGGQSIRYVAGIRPDIVASITTIASPHQGAKLANIALAIGRFPLMGLNFRIFFNNLLSPAIIFGQRLNNVYPHNSTAAFYSISTTGSFYFNHRFPAGLPTTPCGEGPYQQNGIFNYSFMGNKALNQLSVIDGTLYSTSLLINNGGDNDGIVARCDARFGKVIRDNYLWNHINEINHVYGNISPYTANPVDVYRQHANRLKRQGL